MNAIHIKSDCSEIKHVKARRDEEGKTRRKKDEET